MDLNISGKVAIVAAASQGLGKAVAHGLAAEGARVALASRNNAALEQAAEEIRRAHEAEILAVPTDFGKADEISRLVETVRVRFGPIQILFNNSGGPPPAPFEQSTDADWDTAYQATFLSYLRLTRAILPDMRAATWGRILNVAVIESPRDRSISAAFRVGILGWAKSLAAEIGRDGILINSILPARVYSERLVQMTAYYARLAGRSIEEQRRMEEETIPLGRYGQPEEFADMAVFLLSDRLRFTTGATFRVDGGVLHQVT